MTTETGLTTGSSPAPASATPPAPAPAPAPAAEPSIASILYDEPAAAPAPAPDPAAAAPAPADATDKPAPAAEGDQPADAEGSDAETIGTMSELFEHLQLEPEYAQSLKVSVKVNGQTTDVPFSELVKNYQIGAAAEQRLEDAKLKVQAVNQDLAVKTETLQSHLSAAAALVQEAEAELDREFKAIDWRSLKERDPAKYAADQIDFTERGKRIAKLKETGSNAWREAASQRHAEALDQLKVTLATENEALLEAFPTWSDEKVRKAEKAEIVKYLTETVKLSPQQVGVISDHRLIVMARKAMKQDALEAKTTETLQRVRKIPKTLKPRGSKPAAAPKENSIVQDLYET